MRQVLENEYLKVSVEDHGAELVSVYDKENEREELWQAKPPYWNRHAPVLFPNVGKHHNDTYRLDGKEYHTSQHGFARDRIFDCISKTESVLIHRLVSDKDTKSYFPFDFELYITHRLEARQLTVEWNVVNKSGETMYFTIGGHPGFNVPILQDSKQTDYYLLFKKGPALSYKLVYGDSGTAEAKKVYALDLEEADGYYRCRITEHMFDRDAFIFDDTQVEWVGIGYPNGTPYVAMECEGFTNFGIWTMPGGPYICLEPWMGRCDDYGFEEDITEKEDIIALEKGKTFEKSYRLTFYK